MRSPTLTGTLGALLLAGALACGDDGGSGTGPTTNFSGTFLLRAVDNQRLPVTLTAARSPNPVVIIADTLEFNTLGEFDQHTVVGGQIVPALTDGTFAIRGDSLFLFERVSGALIAEGIATADSLNLRSLAMHDFPNHQWAYGRAP